MKVRQAWTSPAGVPSGCHGDTCVASSTFRRRPSTAMGAPGWALQPDDIARTVLWAVAQPEHVDVNEILIRPTAQPS